MKHNRNGECGRGGSGRNLIIQINCSRLDYGFKNAVCFEYLKATTVKREQNKIRDLEIQLGMGQIARENVLLF